ncbi:histone H2A-III-like [Hordeum vulgare subsp. vulgare]|uniref:Histone H2A n=1 Tax=Hordeum vulgare subsp. vulgare TaxID=112509 RepID=F2DX69_HORVV|nr:histone H2A-III-like [Hordeum vulgare subsp. vulgare]BAJ99690.1 predicted protein [Hordeum vulgare subsp. vulgare]
MGISGDSGRGKAKPAGKAKRRTWSCKAGLQFSVRRIARHLKAGRYAERIRATTSVYLAAVLEYLAFEFLERATSWRRKIIGPGSRHASSSWRWTKTLRCVNWWGTPSSPAAGCRPISTPCSSTI